MKIYSLPTSCRLLKRWLYIPCGIMSVETLAIKRHTNNEWNIFVNVMKKYFIELNDYHHNKILKISQALHMKHFENNFNENKNVREQMEMVINEKQQTGHCRVRSADSAGKITAKNMITFCFLLFQFSDENIEHVSMMFHCFNCKKKVNVRLIQAWLVREFFVVRPSSPCRVSIRSRNIFHRASWFRKS
ncbi:CLUMA_CG001588, isoform A [Clunio marinus]|uniref:CLUMA_CG001588, isoform A n=1 Tax=Clunio marinus TaxID=568069 RepID=A0A1J1HMS6_9DIPT|nr:CLUMA_CG001588, isoform A [Clunio marinus]